MSIFLKISIEMILIISAIFNYTQSKKYESKTDPLSSEFDKNQTTYVIRSGYSKSIVSIVLAIVFFFTICI